MKTGAEVQPVLLLYCEYKVAVSMSGDSEEHASLRKKLRAWAQRQVERESRREWLIRIVVAAPPITTWRSAPAAASDSSVRARTPGLFSTSARQSVMCLTVTGILIPPSKLDYSSPVKIQSTLELAALTLRNN